MSKKILAYNAYLQVFALFESPAEAQTMKDQMARCGHTLAIVEVEEFVSGSYAFDACQPKPIVLRQGSVSDSRRSFGSRESVSNCGRPSDDNMFQQVIGSMSSGDSDSCSGD